MQNLSLFQTVTDSNREFVSQVKEKNAKYGKFSFVPRNSVLQNSMKNSSSE